MSSIDQQFVEFVVKSIVSNPDSVQITRTIDEKGVLLELTVSPDDLGRVIGKKGATAQSIRTLLRALGTKNDARYNLKIVDNGIGGGQRSSGAPSGGAWGESDENKKADDQPAEKTEDTGEETPQEPASEDEEESDGVAKARRELADLDDL